MYNTFDVCEQIAEKLKATDLSNEGFSLSLAHGWPGFALFYSTLHNFFPNSRYDELAHNYLEQSISLVTITKFLPLSLFQGVAGICFASHLCSQEGRRYAKLTAKLDQLFLEKLDEHFLQMEKEPFSNTYYLSHGISGALAYLLLKQNNSQFTFFTQKCINKLIELMNRNFTLLGHQLPGWYESSETLWHPKEKDLYTNGKFTIGLISGVTGILSALSIAALEGILVKGQIETILMLANWLKGKQNGLQWPKIISFEKEINPNEPEPILANHHWEEETPFVLRSLYLASKVLKNKSLQTQVEESYLSCTNKETHNFTFIKGKAGLLATTYRIAQESQQPEFFNKVKSIESELTHAFDPTLPFGFKNIEGIKGASLTEGMTGIGLSLLLVQNREDNKWDRLFFLR